MDVVRPRSAADIRYRPSGLVISRMSQNEENFATIMDDKDFSSVIKEWMLKRVYNSQRTRGQYKAYFFYSALALEYKK